VKPALPDGFSDEQVEHLRAAAKEGLRKQLAALRRALPAEARAARARAVCARIVSHASFARARVVLAYWPLRFEVDPRAVVERAWALGKVVALTRIAPGTSELVLRRYTQGDLLHESAFMVMEPAADAPEIGFDEVDLALVPGLGFDGGGQRLGYGKGYYDRLLPRLTRATSVGLAFEVSLLPEIPSASHDAPVHHVVTERRWIDAD
jgi:5-formyltetrahydrofolate cyclo-ligase